MYSGNMYSFVMHKPWRREQQSPSNRWYPPTWPHVISQKTVTWMSRFFQLCIKLKHF